MYNNNHQNFITNNTQVLIMYTYAYDQMRVYLTIQNITKQIQ